MTRSASEVVISDSEPEEAAGCFGAAISSPHANAHTHRAPLRPLNDLHAAGSLPRRRQKDVVVISSASEDDESEFAGTSRFFGGARKRQRAPTPRVEWSLSRFRGLEPLDQLGRGTSPAELLAHDERPRPESRDSGASSSSFVSALDLLRQSATPPASELDELPPPGALAKGRPVKPDTGTATRPPVAESGRSKKPKGKARAQSRDPTPSRPSKRRSISPVSTSEDAVPAPSLWSERFTRVTDLVGDRASSQEVKPPNSARAKPWEALEAKLAVSRAKKPPRRRVSDCKTSVANTSTATAGPSQIEPIASDSDDIIIAGTSTKPVPKLVKKRPLATLDLRPEPIELPADERLRVLRGCALCETAWAASKVLSARQSHLRLCAGKLDYTAETVRHLVEKQILETAEAAELERRKLDDERTLFDLTVGKGEGSTGVRDVTVVGIEGLENSTSAEWYKATHELQAQLDAARKKTQVARVVKIAKQIRRERLEAQGSKREGDAGGEEAADLPPSTGRLAPASTTVASVVAERVGAVLGPRAATPDLDEAGEGECLSPLRPTQQFEASRVAGVPAIASHCFVAAASSPSPASVPRTPSPPAHSACEFSESEAGRPRRPFRELSLPDPRSGSIPRQGHPPQYSLWRLAAGRDDAHLGTVVLKKPAHLAGDAGTSSSEPAPEAASSPARRSPRHGADVDAPFGSPNSSDDGGIVLSGGAEESASSSEEALEDVVKKLASPKRRRRRASTGASSSSSSDVNSPSRASSPRAVGAKAAPAATASEAAAEMPDFAALAVTTLQRKVRQYGFRASKEKDVLVAQLEQVWTAMHQGGGGGGDMEAMPAMAPKGGRKKPGGRGRGKALETADGESGDDVPGAAAAAAEPDETVGEKLRALIVAETSLYLRILRYEPVHIDDFAELAAANGIKVARPLLTRFLDEQSITHYSQDPTGGPRRRYR